jgi:predicted ATP-dependent serine protease
MDVAAPGTAEILQEAATERVSSGFEGLDAMLGGGVFRGSSTLITGAPGTSKTTLAAQFAASACRRGERTLFVSFDEDEARHVSLDERENELRKMRGAEPADTVAPVHGKRRIARTSARSRTNGEKEPKRGP